ncbi:MAG: heavy metal-binding domain-containing protein, partial [Ferruginibacter sp.]
MTHTYMVTGMTCSGCQAKVQSLLSGVAGVDNVSIDLAKGEATIDMKKHVATAELKSVLKDFKYKIEEKNGSHAMTEPAAKKENKSSDDRVHNTSNKSSGKYYCPMHCEGNKIYDKPGDCPVCGMNLEKVPSAPSPSERAGGEVTQYTCPMHPQIIRDVPGACPICGMDLVPMQAEAKEENKTYKVLLKKLKVAIAFTIPILIIAMSDMIPNNPLLKIMRQDTWNWIQLVLSIPVVFYAGWMFFQRAWKSVITWNLNMFTLIGIGTGVAFLFSIIAMLFPGIFPDQFKTGSGTVFVYFEAATVILALVLLGQLLEARAHSKTS